MLLFFQAVDCFSILILHCFSAVLFVPDLDPQSYTYNRWVMVELLAIVLIAFVVFQVVALLSITIWLRERGTGLRWDIESIADLLVLIRHSNSLAHIQPLGEHEDSKRGSSEEFHPRRLRLGYWKMGNNIVHTIGTEGLVYHTRGIYPTI